MLRPSSSLATVNKQTNSQRIDSNSYLLSLASLQGIYAAASSSPADSIHFWDQRTLKSLATIPTQASITSVRAVNAIVGQHRRSLLSSSKDGTIKLWDERTHTPSLTLSANRPILAFDVSEDGLTIGAGSELVGEDALLVYFDPRQPAAPLRTNAFTHSDDITSIQFRGRTLLSASTDGLISLSNVDEPDEDESVVQVINWGCSISQTGFMSDGGVWAASDMETFGLWTSEFDSRLSIDIREPSVHSQNLTWVTDYLITACTTPTDELAVFIGSNEGDVALISFESTTPTLDALWTHGHVGVVRSLLWDQKNGVLLTGGEDSKLGLWTFPRDIYSESTEMDIDSQSTSSTRKRTSGPHGMDVDEQSGKRVRKD